MDKDFLDDFMPSESEAPEAVETAEAVEPQPEPAPVRDEKGRFAPKGETPEPETVQESVEPTDKPLDKDEFQGLKNERKRRQEAEERLQALEKQLQQLQAKPQEPPAPPPSLWDDEDQRFAYERQQVLSQADRLSRINASEMAARVKYDDFDAMFDKFNEMAAQNPAVVQQTLDTSGTPSWLKAYDIAKKAARIEELGAVDLTDLETRLREQIKAEMAAQAPAPAPAIPSSLADAQSSRSAGQGVAPMTLKDILGR